MTPAFWLQNLLFYSLQVLLVVLAGGALAYLVRLRNPRVELGYLQGLLLLCLLLPFLQPWQTLVLSPETGDLEQAVIPAREPARQGRDASDGWIATFPPVAWLLLGGVAIRMSWLGVGLLRLTRYRRRSQPLPLSAPFVPALQRQFWRRAELRLSGEVRGPVTFGWRRPVILLPERFLQFEPNLQQAVLCHELLHVARRDWVFTVVEEFIRALLWFHPAIWWLIGRIHLLREQVVDREAIRVTDSKEPYLRALLAMAGHQLQPDLAPASLFLRKHHLDQRISAVVRREFPMSRFRSVAWLSLMSGIVGIAVGIAAATFPLQVVPQQAPDYGAGPLPSVRIPNAGVVEQGGEKLLQQPFVAYSIEAYEKGVEGRVVLELSLDDNGRVYDAMVISGPQELRRPSLMSALLWQFSKDMPLPTKLAVTIRFELPRGREAVAPGDLPAPAKRIRVGGAVEHARLIPQVQPQYPALARQAGIEGVVQPKVSINPAGGVDRLDVVQGHPLLIPAALEAVKQWEYRPTLLNGLPVDVETNVEVAFRLNSGGSSGASDGRAMPPPPPPAPLP